jgi:serine/threonine protein kinase
MEYQSNLQAGTVLKATYIIEKMLGVGGFSLTYLAHHINISTKRFVIKEFFLSGICVRADGATVQTDSNLTHKQKFDTYKSKFVEEARTLASLEGNLHIVEVSDFFYEHNTAYMVMTYIQGENLDTYTRQHAEERLPISEAIHYVEQAAMGLQAAHQKNILHRDIKPANLMRQPNGNIVLIDFGAAREYISLDRSQLMSVIYTPGYAPFEQYSSKAKRGAYTDIYALGATLYRFVTGVIPSDALTNMTHPLQAPDQLNNAIPSELNQIILKMMANQPSERYQTIESLLIDLKRASTWLPPVVAHESATGSPSRKGSSEDTIFGDAQQPPTPSQKEVSKDRSEDTIFGDAQQLPTPLQKEVSKVVQNAPSPKNVPTVVQNAPVPPVPQSKQADNTIIDDTNVGSDAVAKPDSDDKRGVLATFFSKTSHKIWTAATVMVVTAGMFLGRQHRPVQTTVEAPPTPTIDSSAMQSTSVAAADTISLPLPQSAVAETPKTDLKTDKKTKIKVALPPKSVNLPVVVSSPKTPSPTQPTVTPVQSVITPPVIKIAPPPCPLMSSTIENLKDFTENSWIQKNLSKISCGAFSVSFVIKANGMIADPQLLQCKDCNKGCSERIINAIKTLPQLKTPMTLCNGKSVPCDFKFTFSK